MKVFKEIDNVRITEDVAVAVIRDNSKRMVRAGSSGAVVLVLGAPEKPESYMIEFFISEIDDFALGTVMPEILVAA